MSRIAIILAVFVTLMISIFTAASRAIAAVKPTVWTAAKTQTLLTSGAATFYGVRTGQGGAAVSGAPLHKAATAVCRRTAPGTFSCALTWPSPNDPAATVKATLFVRPWTTKAVCVTDVSLGSCPPPAPTKRLAGDPRGCGADQAGCVLRAANDAMKRAIVGMVGPTGRPASVTACHATTLWTQYVCTVANVPAGSGTGTVSFITGTGGWTARAVVTP